jgi:hypothetical protein
MHIRFVTSAIMTVVLLSSPTFGQCDLEWKPTGSGMSNYVYALTVYKNELIAGGLFTNAGGIVVNHIARWDGNNWQSMGSGTDGEVCSLVVYDGKLIAGGQFAKAGNVDVNNIAQWDGNSWQPLGKGITGYNGFSKPVAALTIYNDELIAGGSFIHAGEIDVNNVARWNGNFWRPLGKGIVNNDAYFYTIISSFAVYNNELIIGGDFNKAGDIDANHITGWNGNAWRPLGKGMSGGIPQFTPGVYSVMVYDGELIAVGSFSKTGSLDVNGIARWNGNSWQSLNGGMSGIFFAVNEMTIYNGELIAGGYFTKAGGIDVNHIARWNGSNWQPLGKGITTNGAYFTSIAAFTTYKGELIAGGSFTTAGGVASANWARWGAPEVYEGDLNHDCSVDLYDLSLLVERWLNDDCMYNGWCYEADLNYDFKVDFADFDNMAANWLAGE